jgi:malonate-semialdehyde dehydrogenase (acetylating)/methylmalonate-semialdehyde dehydrogenase
MTSATATSTKTAPPRKHYGRLKNYINGRWVDSASAEVHDIVNPATGQVIAQVPYSTPDEVNEAVQAAKAAFRTWQDVPPVRRARPFFILKQLMEEQAEALATVLVQELGKTLADARAEMRRAIEEVECACGIPSLIKGDLHDTISPDIDLQVVYVPRGVFFMVPSFNFPALVPLEYMPYAVACGNSYIVKPSPIVPISQVRIFELIDQCGFPPGVINLVHGDAEVVNLLLQHPDTEGFSFVGSTPVGRRLYARAASYGKRGQCATGAKNHFVVLPDADLDAAVAAILSSFFGAAGQRCLAGSVLVPVGEVYRPLVEKLVAAASQMKIGDGMDESVELGPVVTHRARARIVGYIEQGLAEGARLLLDGRGVQVEGYPDGAFLGPTIFDDVTPEMVIAQEEIFGPVCCILRADTLDQALERIQASPFGHSAMLFTSSGAAAREFQHRATCGNIGINIGVAATQAYATLGGLKQSAYGDLHGRSESVLFFTDRKIVVSRWGGG